MVTLLWNKILKHFTYGVCILTILSGNAETQSVNISDDFDIYQEIEDYMKDFMGLYTSNAMEDIDSLIKIEEKEVNLEGGGGIGTLTKYSDTDGNCLRYRLDIYGETMNVSTNYYICNNFVFVSEQSNYYSSWVLTAGYDDILYSQTDNWIILDDAAYALYNNGSLKKIEAAQLENEFYTIDEIESMFNQRDKGSEFIYQTNIMGRTQEETELIRKILEENHEEFESFLLEENRLRNCDNLIGVFAYDFTGDGKEEIIVSKIHYISYVSVSFTHNYVYDCNGNRLSEFYGGIRIDETQIISGWDGNGTFLLRDRCHYGADNNLEIYTEIKWENSTLEAELKMVAYDTRNSAGGGGYYIFKDFTQEEAEELLFNFSGLLEFLETKNYVAEDNKLGEYQQLFETMEITEASTIGYVYYENDGYVWY